MKNLALILIGAIIGVVVMMMDWGESVQNVAKQVQTKALTVAMEATGLEVEGDLRAQVLIDNPVLIARLSEGGSFGGDNHSRVAAMNIFGVEHEESVEDVRDRTRIEPAGDRMWLIRMPIVNAALIETDGGLVLVDAGMGPSGPAIVDMIKSVSDKPVHTLVYTHGHVDHAYGAPAIVKEWNPEIIAHSKLVERVKRYQRMPGSFAKYMSQKRDQIENSLGQFGWPTQTFSGNEFTFEVGGEEFVLKHYPGETDDQLFVWIPSRKAIVSADYYQGFLPNAGNGKRVQRYVEEWALALREMVRLQPEVLMPNHGALQTDPAKIAKNLTLLADALQHIVDYTIAELDKGTRKDIIFQNAELPPHLASEHSLRETYVTVKDISKMVLKRYTGWWDDIPSNWSPAPLADQGQAIIDLAGGLDALDTYAREKMTQDIRLSAHLADYAFYAQPDNPKTQQLIMDVYRQRILDRNSNTQEMIAYIDQMVEAKKWQLKARQ